MKIYIVDSTKTNTQLALGTASLMGSDVLIVEKPGGITAAYPISEIGKELLDTLGLRSHRQPEYNTSFYPIPFMLHNALVDLDSKFQLEWVNAPTNAKSSEEYHKGDLVICPTVLGNEVLEVTGTRPIPPGGEKMTDHKQFVTAGTKRASLTPMSGAHFVMVCKKQS